MLLGLFFISMVWQVVTLLLFLTSCNGDVSKYAPKPGEFKRLDGAPANKTIDQLLTEALGGIDVASNKILAPGSYVLAELDMYLSQQQFLALYQPPSSNLMLSNRKDTSVLRTRNKRRSVLDVIASLSRDEPNASDDAVAAERQTAAKDSRANDVIPPLRQKRKAIRDVVLRWPKAEVPYHLAFGDFSAKEEYLIKQAMTEWERYTCVTFRPAASNDVNLVRFQNGEGCISQLGMVGGVQILTLDTEGCRFKGLYLHEIGHALGLVHEHQLPDRDDYIDILMENVAPHFRVFFSKYSSDVINQFKVPYEYSSVMHYGISAFSHDGASQTIRTKDPSKEESIGRVYLKELAFSDVKVVNQMYGCAASCPDLVRCSGDGFLDQNCRCVCPDGTDSCQQSTIRTQANGGSSDILNDNSSDNNSVVIEHCENLYDSWKCSVWANQGECERNPKYMKQNCKRSCGVCEKEGSKEEETKNHFTTWAWQWFGMFTNLFPKDWMIGVCKDVYSYEKCYKWREQGDCVTNTGWMKKNCKMTCNFCGNPIFQPEANCRNHHDNAKCDQWALEGECVLNPKWMRDHCQRSCRACVDVQKPELDDDGRTDEKENCTDLHDTKECKGWAKRGECYINPTWMIANCRKSCDKCSDGGCKDLYDENQCRVWAQDNECAKNRVWMHNNCMKACGLCRDNVTTPDQDQGEKEEEDDEREEKGRTGTGKDGTGGKGTGTGNGKDPVTRTGTSSTRRPSAVTLAPRTTAAPDTAHCYNAHNNVECQNWAATDHCQINPSWMNVNCRKACGQCDDDRSSGREVGCHDRTKGCDGWAKTGFCESNPGYNLIYCKKSCDNCNGCRDEQFLCGLWASAGHCHTNAGYMLRECQKSCNTCST